MSVLCFRSFRRVAHDSRELKRKNLVLSQSAVTFNVHTVITPVIVVKLLYIHE